MFSESMGQPQYSIWDSVAASPQSITQVTASDEPHNEEDIFDDFATRWEDARVREYADEILSNFRWVAVFSV